MEPLSAWVLRNFGYKPRYEDYWCGLLKQHLIEDKFPGTPPHEALRLCKAAVSALEPLKVQEYYGRPIDVWHIVQTADEANALIEKYPDLGVLSENPEGVYLACIFNV